MNRRVLLVFLSALLWFGFEAAAQDVVERCSYGDDLNALRELDQKIGPRQKSGLGVPNREFGSPQYLVRVIYLIPKDRQPANAADYSRKVEAATLRIRASLEMMSQYFAAQLAENGVGGVSSVPNFERDPNGRIRVIALRGSQPTLWYWGDSTGQDSPHVQRSAMLDIFGTWDAVGVACAKTIYMVLPDTLTIDGSGPKPVWRGYVGGGVGIDDASSGMGGYCSVTYGVLEFLPEPVTDDKEGREQSFRSGLCNGSLIQQVGGYVGRLAADAPNCGGYRDMTTAELLSIYEGALAHEFGHSCGLGHDSISYGLMGGAYLRYGQSVRELLGGDQCPAISLASSGCSYSGLGPEFARRLSMSPYFQIAVNPDKTNPAIDVAWPPSGYLYDVEGETRYDYVRIAATDTGGSGLSSAIVYEDGWSKNYKLFVTGLISLNTHNTFSFPLGRRELFLQAVDRAGNAGSTPFTIFGQSEWEGASDALRTDAVWVRRPPSEDNRRRYGSKALGSFDNPFGDIQTAIDAVAPIANSKCAIFIGRGIWPITTSLRPRYRVALTGEGFDQTILDGGGAALNILSADAATGVFQQAACANLTMRNARSGIVAASNADRGYYYTIANCLFTGMQSDAVNLGAMSGSVDISQNTVYQCGGGIRLRNYAPFLPNDRFTFRNNMAVKCTSIGFELTDVAGLVGNPRVGGNLAFSNGTNWSGSGSGGTSPAYGSTRWPGEVSVNPGFVSDAPVAAEDFKLKSSSPALHRGLAPTENLNETRRNIGVWLNDYPPNPGNMWKLD